MATSSGKIIYTKIDEAPALATASLLPIIEAYTKGAGFTIETWDISFSGRIIAQFSERLTEHQRVPDFLTKLGDLVKTPEANIIKLPNISASIPQLKGAIKELKEQGYDLPDYPDNPTSDAEKEDKERYARVLGSAVNPVLREGNSDRRAPTAVKKFGRKFPHKMMREWPKPSKTRVAHMTDGDFFGSEISATIKEAGNVRIEFVADDGRITSLKEKIELLEDEIVDAAVMNIRTLRKFYEKQMQDAKDSDVLLSLHLKATMMKVSDPIMFGHCVSVFYKDVLAKHAAPISELGFNVNNGLGDLYAKIQSLPDAQRKEIEADLEAVYETRPSLAMVDSSKGITNLHVPSDVIVDASMPVVVRDGGKMWGPDNKPHDTIALIPDRSYAILYHAIIEDCKKNGAFDPAKMGSVSNVGLMAQQAEEYGSHDKTFEAPGDGVIRVVFSSGKTLMERRVEEGDIFRVCQVKDAPIQDWVKLGINRAKATGAPAVFWLDRDRAHDTELIKKVKEYLTHHDTEGLEIHILSSIEAMKFTLERVRAGKDTISVTGNVLRDYITDLFPILEIGTSAKMLSIVPLMNGGGLFETGAGGSAPKHVQQFLQEGHLRWDSIGEFCAIGASLEHFGNSYNSASALILAETLDQAVSKILENGKSPSRKVNELDNRGSHFYLALYWAQALADQTKNREMQARFSKVAQELAENESKIIEELNAAQGKPVDIGGYFHADPELLGKAMRPSATFIGIVDAIS